LKDVFGIIWGVIAGIEMVVAWIFGGYIEFEAKLRWMKKFYKFVPNFKNQSLIQETLKDNFRVDF